MADGRDLFLQAPIRNREMVPAFISTEDYVSGSLRKAAEKAAETRQTDVAAIYNSLSEENFFASSDFGRNDGTGIWSGAQSEHQLFTNVQQALEPFQNLQTGQHVTFYDIEALGTPERLRSTNHSSNFFSPTEIALRGQKFNGKSFAADINQTLAMVIAPSKENQELLQGTIDAIRSGQHTALTDDMKRSVRDLIKYSDVSKFVKNKEYNVMEIVEHARIPPSGAFTSATIEQMQIGLDNLSRHGNNLNTALDVFDNHMVRHGSILAGFNIHAYDNPALGDVMTGQGRISRWQQWSKSALDFYKAGQLSVSDPYTFFGGSRRQEKIHAHFTKNLPGFKPRQSRYEFHRAADDILASVEVADPIFNEINNFLKQNTSKTARNGKDFPFHPVNIDTTTMKAGDTLFAVQGSGFDAMKKNKYDLVAEITGEGKAVPKWKNLDTSLPVGESFRIDSFFQAGDKGLYGVRLDSVGEDGAPMKNKSLILMAEKEEELAQKLHGYFRQEDSLTPSVVNRYKEVRTQIDRPMREYNRMFDTSTYQGGGSGLMGKFYGYLEAGQAEMAQSGMELSSADWQRIAIQGGASATQAEKFSYIVPRLADEQEMWKSMMASTEFSSLDATQKDTAIRHMKSKLDTSAYRQKVKIEGMKARRITFNGEDYVELNARNVDNIKSVIRGEINDTRGGTRAGKAHISVKQQKVNNLVGNLLDQMEMGGSREGDKIRAIADGMIGEIGQGGNIETMIESMASIVRGQIELKGSNEVERELANISLTAKNGSVGRMHANLPDVIQSSLSYAKTMSTSKKAFANNPGLAEFAQRQDETISQLMKNNFSKYNLSSTKGINNLLTNRTTYTDTLQRVLDSYAGDFQVGLFQMGGQGNYHMALAEVGSNIDFSKLSSMEDFAMNPNIALVELPSIGADGAGRYAGGKRVLQTRMGMREGAEYYTDNITAGLESLVRNKKKASNARVSAMALGEKNQMLKIQSMLSKGVRDATSPVASVYGVAQWTKEFDQVSSLGFNQRSGMVDVSGFAEGWYAANAATLGIETPIEKVRSKMNRDRVGFFDAMDAKSKALFYSQSGADYIREITDGLVVTPHGSTKDSAGRAIMATGAGAHNKFVALGAYYADAGENISKTSNYLALDGTRTRKILEGMGPGEADWRMRGSFITDSANTILEQANEVRGLQMQSAYMTDVEIATRLRDTNVMQEAIRELDGALSRGEITETEFRSMRRALDQGVLSTSEGLAFMDNRFMDAFSVDTRKSITVKSGDFTLNDGFRQILVDAGLDVEAFMKSGGELATPIDLTDSLGALIDAGEGTFTIGDYTRGGVTDRIAEGKAFVKGDKVQFLGMETDGYGRTSFLFNRFDEGRHGLKTVTEGGLRTTSYGMHRGVLEVIAGEKGVSFVGSHLPAKKGALDLPALIRGIDTDIRQQFEGATSVEKSQLVARYGTKEAALEALYSDVESKFGITTEGTGADIRTVSDELGMDGSTPAFKGALADNLESEWAEALGRNRILYGDIVMRHDVDSRQGIAGRGKVTIKEVDMLERGYMLSGVTAPGEESAHGRWLRDMIYGSRSTAEGQRGQQRFREVLRAQELGRGGYWVPQDGDAVVDFTSDGIASAAAFNSPDGTALRNAEMRGGVLNISDDGFQVAPTTTAVDDVFTAGDLSNTIINAHAININEDMGAGSRQLKNYLDETGGMLYMRLPEYAKQQHMPVLNANLMDATGKTADQQVFLDRLHAAQVGIHREVDRYDRLAISNNVDPALIPGLLETQAAAVNNQIDNYMAAMEGLTTGSGAADVTSRRLDNSVQLRMDGDNPFSNYRLGADGWQATTLPEGVQRINPEQLRVQLGDSLSTWQNVAGELDIDVAGLNLENAQAKVLAGWNTADGSIYSVANRFPSINSSVIQSMRVELDDSVGAGQMRVARGTAERLKADFDGDVGHTSLDHYAIRDAKERSAVLKDIVAKNQYDTDMNRMMGATLMQREYDGLLSDAAGAFGVEANDATLVSAMNEYLTDGRTTVGSLHGRDANETLASVMRSSGDRNSNTWGEVKLGVENYTQETWLARSTMSNYVGGADNVRDRMTKSFAFVELAKHQAMGGEYDATEMLDRIAHVQEFNKEFSQKLISSKKLDAGGLTAADIVSRFDNQIKQVRGVSGINEEALEGLVDELSGSLFAKAPIADRPGYQVPTNAQWGDTERRGFIRDALVYMSENEQLARDAGISSSQSSSLAILSSQGVSNQAVGNLLSTGKHANHGTAISLVERFASEGAQENLQQYSEALTTRIGEVYKNHAAQRQSDLIAQASNVHDIINVGGARSIATSNVEMPIHRTLGGTISASAADMSANAIKGFSSGGALAAGGAAGVFAGLWATRALFAGAPTPEGLQEMTPVDPSVMASGQMQGPTARVVENDGEYINIRVRGNSRGVDNQALARAINTEVLSMAGVQMNTNVNVNDNSQNLDNDWFQGVVANSLTKGYAF